MMCSWHLCYMAAVLALLCFPVPAVHRLKARFGCRLAVALLGPASSAALPAQLATCVCHRRCLCQLTAPHCESAATEHIVWHLSLPLNLAGVAAPQGQAQRQQIHPLCARGGAVQQGKLRCTLASQWEPHPLAAS